MREFVPEGLPWAHIDIAGPAYHSGEPTGYLAKGGTGVPLRLLLELLDDIAANGYDLSLNRYKEVVQDEIQHASPREILRGLAQLESEIHTSMKELEAMLK